MADMRPIFALWALRDATRPRQGTKTTSPQAAREACGWAADYLERGEPLPDELRAHLVAALRTAATGGDIARALGLNRSAGARIDPRDQRAREWEILQRVEELTDAGRSPAEAKEQAASEFGIEPRRVEQILAAWPDGK